MDGTFASRLKWALEKSGMKPTDLSNITGIGKSSISRYLKGEYIPKQKKLNQIATVLNVSEGWLLTGLEQKAASAKGVRIPVLGRVAAGIPISAITDIEDWEEIPEALAKSGEYFALRIKGQSMEPRICDGDVVIVKQESCVDSGDVAIVLVNGDEATVKEIKILDSGIMLIGWNTAVYSPRFYSKEDIINLPVKIIGKVVELRGKF
uniref:LexA family protein n=1 Tax=uncultured Allisonella sp. TaxID=339338 RepID=UPI002670ABED|nr:LexA family transcriptional regulator [uncultured Allisonella sp.]